MKKFMFLTGMMLIVCAITITVLTMTGCTSIFGEMSDSEKAALRAEVISLAKQGTAAAAKIYIKKLETDGKIDASTAEEFTKIVDNIAAGATPAAAVETETPAADTTGADSPAVTPAATTTAE
jgi:hypothetical protein